MLIFFSKGRSISDIESYFDVLPALDSAAGGEGVEVLLCILSRQGECGEHQEVSVFGQVSTPFFGALKFEFCISENVNKIIVLLSKMQDLQGFCVKKDPARFLLQGQFFCYGFTNWVCPKS